MNINFGFNPFEDLQEQCEIEVTLGNQVIERNSLPVIFAKGQFMQMVKQLSTDSRPIKAVCYRKDFTEEGRELNNSIIFKNPAFVSAFGED